MIVGPYLLWNQYFVESCEAAAAIVPSVKFNSRRQQVI